MARLNQEEIKTGLELALEEILNVDNLNVWISVKERPIGKILKDCGIDVRYNPHVMNALVKLGLMEEEGERIGKVYRIKSKVIPDVKYLVKKILEDIKNSKPYTTVTVDNSHDLEGYPVSKASDLRPKRECKPRKKQEESSPAVKVSNVRSVVIPNLGDMRFLIYKSCIVEGRIISIHYGAIQKFILYDVEIINPKWIRLNNVSDEAILNDVKERKVLKDLEIRDLFETADGAADYLVRHVVKYKSK